MTNLCLKCFNWAELLEFGLYHNESLPEGLQDVADTLTPKLAACVSVLFVFCVGCSIVLQKSFLTIQKHSFHFFFFLISSNSFDGKRTIGIDWVRSKPLLGVAALLCPLLAIVRSADFNS